MTNQEVAQQVYDLIMEPIEPDLLLANIPLLDAKYAGESQAEHEARMQRYQAAYKKFDREMEKFLDAINTSVRSTQREALKARENEDRRREQEQLTSLASAFV
jgi:uncharacterized protein YukE